MESLAQHAPEGHNTIEGGGDEGPAANTGARKNVYKLCGEFLQRAWLNSETGEREKGSQYNQHVECLLKCYLNNYPAQGGSGGWEGVKTYVCPSDGGPLSEVLKHILRKKDGKGEAATSSQTHPTFSRSTFLLHYRILFQHLVMSVRDRIAYTSNRDGVEELNIWSAVVQQFHGNSRIWWFYSILRYS